MLAQLYGSTAGHFLIRLQSSGLMVAFPLDAGPKPPARQYDPGHSDHGFMPLNEARMFKRDLLETEPGHRLETLTGESRGCNGVLVEASDTKLSILAERTLGKASRRRKVAKLNGIGSSGYRKGESPVQP